MRTVHSVRKYVFLMESAFLLSASWRRAAVIESITSERDSGLSVWDWPDHTRAPPGTAYRFVSSRNVVLVLK